MIYSQAIADFLTTILTVIFAVNLKKELDSLKGKDTDKSLTIEDLAI